ncbi:hypothetical protein KX729_03835 [Rhizobium sp. XQZ8]|uniref:DUF6985 domain-containing protein n=1 Tax=Rhizobium populisoli TaxID=2859785 RepID=UPI001CA53DB5|nr:hypothetical protein [Rhizobium populisoli]MBW6420561.1 hypothetical protein [Rhizobium populisoli]
MEAQIVLQDILEGEPDAMAEFLGTTPLSCCDRDRKILAAILPSHPQWNARPDPGGEIGYVLKVGEMFSEIHFHIPASHEYRALRIVAIDPVVFFEIDTENGTIKTNMQELGQKMIEWTGRTEAERLAAFDGLTNEFNVPVARIRPKAFTSKTLGRIKPDEFGDIWEAKKIAIPYFDGKSVETQLFDISGDDVAAIDMAMRNFLALKAEDRDAAAPLVLDNCREFLEAVGAETDEDRQMAEMTDASGIWRFVDCQALQITRDQTEGEPSIYISLICDCAWEPEHGLQIVYRNGETLSRVSAQDGSVI